MESVDQRDTKLVQGIQGATQPASQQPFSLTEDLRQAGVNTTHIVGLSVEELINGEGGDTRDRVVASKNPFKWALERARALKAKFKKPV